MDKRSINVVSKKIIKENFITIEDLQLRKRTRYYIHVRGMLTSCNYYYKKSIL